MNGATGASNDVTSGAEARLHQNSLRQTRLRHKRRLRHNSSSQRPGAARLQTRLIRICYGKSGPTQRPTERRLRGGRNCNRRLLSERKLA